MVADEIKRVDVVVTIPFVVSAEHVHHIVHYRQQHVNTGVRYSDSLPMAITLHLPTSAEWPLRTGGRLPDVASLAQLERSSVKKNGETAARNVSKAVSSRHSRKPHTHVRTLTLFFFLVGKLGAEAETSREGRVRPARAVAKELEQVVEHVACLSLGLLHDGFNFVSGESCVALLSC